MRGGVEGLATAGLDPVVDRGLQGLAPGQKIAVLGAKDGHRLGEALPEVPGADTRAGKGLSLDKRDKPCVNLQPVSVQTPGHRELLM